MPPSQTQIKAVFFDFMGTCLDWHSGVVAKFPHLIAKTEASKLALEWRKQYFVEISQRFHQNLDPEDIDETLARTLDVVINQIPGHKAHFSTEVKKRLVEAWHYQTAWPEVQEAIRSIRDDLGYEVFVHANGTTRLQLDLARSSGLHFNMLFSSQLLGCYKPSPDAYKKALSLVKLKPEEVVMVAAHAYDLRGAKKCGMHTVYIHRWTDDVNENMEKVEAEFDVFLESMEDLPTSIGRI